MSHEAAVSNSWIKLAGLPTDSAYGDVARISNNSFVSIVRHTVASGIRAYNVHSDKWEYYCGYPANFKSKKHALIYNEDNEKLYLYGSLPQITMIDTKTGAFDMKNQQKGIEYPCMVNIDGMIHIIGGKGNSNHLIYNDDRKMLEKDVNDINYPDFCDIEHSKTVYVSSKKVILLIGGYGSNKECIGIWKFSLKTRCWTILKCGKNFNFCQCNAVLTKDEKNVIIMNGFKIDFNSTSNHHHRSNNIYILNIPEYEDDDKYLLLKCKNIITPKGGKQFIVKTGGDILIDELIVFGWIRKLNINNLSMYCINLILKYYKLNEMIHFMERDYSNNRHNTHYAIFVNDILCSVNNIKEKGDNDNNENNSNEYVVNDRSFQLTQNVMNILRFILLSWRHRA